MKILILEDAPTRLNLVNGVLQSSGHDVALLAITADDVILSIKAVRPDAILLDVRLPGIRSFAVARLCREDLETRDVPIIAITAHPEDYGEDEARRAGCDDYIVEPINTWTLLRRIEDLAAAKATTPPLKAPASKLLVVDDITMNRKLLRAVLEAEGYAVFEAVDGAEALQILADDKMDAVISDVLMPNMDGFRLCYEIRRSAKLHDLPFIIYTSTYKSLDDVKLAKTLGADKYLMKPAPAQMVLQALREVIAKKAPRPAPPPATIEESYVLKQYSEALVSKLAEKNDELTQSLEEVQAAHGRIVELNFDLERLVKERTAQLQTTNEELMQSIFEVKELNALLPICSYCKKIRDDQNYWQSVEGYLSQHTDPRFGHGVCPDCFEQHLKQDLEEISITSVPNPVQGDMDP